MKSVYYWRKYIHFDMVWIFDRSHSGIYENCDFERSWYNYCDCVSNGVNYDYVNENEIERNKECGNFERSYGIDYESDCDNDLSMVYLGVNV